MQTTVQKLSGVITAVTIVICALCHTCLTCTIEPPFREHKVIAITASTQAQLDRINTILTTYCEVRTLSEEGVHLDRRALLIVTPQQFEALRLASTTSSHQPFDRHTIPPITVLSDDLEDTLAKAPKQRSGYKRRNFLRVGRPASVLGLDEDFYSQFSTLRDLQNKWSELSELYSPHMTQTVVGRSYEGRDIIALRIGKTDSDDPKRIFINGLQHAREWIAAHVPTYIAESLAVSASAGDDALARLLEKVEVIIVPVVNPDGYVYSHESFRFQRKNRRRAGCRSDLRDGVDLNRNWGKNFSGGESPGINPCTDTFFGTNAFSEPETRAIRNLILDTPGIDAHVDFHSYGALVLGPWSHTKDINDKPPRAKEHCDVGTFVGRAMTKIHGLEYTLGKGTDLYVVGGTMTDWVAGENIVSLTIELRPSFASENGGTGFLLSEDEILPTCQEGLEAVKALLQFSADPRSVSGACSSSDKSPLPNPEVDGDRADTEDTGIDIAFVLGMSLGGLLLIVLIGLIILVARRAKRSPTSIAEQEDVPVE